MLPTLLIPSCHSRKGWQCLKGLRGLLCVPFRLLVPLCHAVLVPLVGPSRESLAHFPSFAVIPLSFAISQEGDWKQVLVFTECLLQEFSVPLTCPRSWLTWSSLHDAYVALSSRQTPHPWERGATKPTWLPRLACWGLFAAKSFPASFQDAVSAATDEERLVKIHDVIQQLPPPHYR